VAGAERRSGRRREASTLGPVVARLVGGSEVRLIDFSRRGVLLESETRLLIGARASIKITTTDAVVTVAGYVVRSRVAGVRDSALVYHTALALNDDLGLLEQAAQMRERLSNPAEGVDEPVPELQLQVQEAPDLTAALDAAAAAPVSDLARASGSGTGSEPAYVTETVTGSDAPADSVLEFLATVPHDLAELRRRAAVNNW
jgi:PilZ domain